MYKECHHCSGRTVLLAVANSIEDSVDGEEKVDELLCCRCGTIRPWWFFSKGQRLVVEIQSRQGY